MQCAQGLNVFLNNSITHTSHHMAKVRHMRHTQTYIANAKIFVQQFFLIAKLTSSTEMRSDTCVFLRFSPRCEVTEIFVAQVS